MVTLQNIRGFIFDLDGTLVTSSLDFSVIKSEIGCPDNDDVLTYIEALNPKKRDWAMDIVHCHEREDAETCDWIAGAEGFIEACKQRSIPMAILTRNSAFSSHIKIERNQIPIDYLVTRECSKPKPDPSALLDIAKEFDLPPCDVMMVGDYRYDLEAGRNARMPSCLINYEQLPDYAHLADYVFPDFSAFYEAVFKH